MEQKPEFNGWEHAKQAASFVQANLTVALKTCGIWLALLVLSMAAIDPVASWLVQNSTDFVAFVRSSEDPRAVQLLFMLPFIVIMAVAWPSVAVAWHRFVLRREEPPLLPFSPLRGGAYLLLTALFSFLVWVVPGATLAIIFSSMAEPNWVVILIWLAFFAGIMGLSMRFSLKLPAIALSDAKMTFMRSWKETDVMWPGMLWGTVVLTVLLYILTRAIDFLAGRIAEQGEMLVSVLLTTINLTAVFAGVLLYVTFLSLSYQRAVGDTSTTFD